MKAITAKCCFILIFLFNCFICFSQQQKSYFVSANGNDQNAGNSSEKPWRSIEKINLSSGLFNPGDSILFRRGDTFTGALNITVNGSPDDSIYVGAYGKGNKPVISGAKKISGWELHENGIYKAYYPDAPIKNLYVNNQLQTLARYPNAGFLNIDKTNEKKGFKCESLQQDVMFWKDANVIVRTNNWTWEKKRIKSFIAGNIVFETPASYECREQWGFYLNNHLQALDSVGEWYYNTNDKYLYLKLPGGKNPEETEVEAVIFDTGLSVSGEYCAISELNFEKYSNAGININCRSTSVFGCCISKTCYYGIKVRAPHTSFVNCQFNDIYGNGIDLFSSVHATIEGCRFNNIGLHPELSLSGQQKQVGILSISSTNTIVRHCLIDSVGYSGILFLSDSCVVEKNIITHAMMRLNDGGALYCYGATAKHGMIRNNIIEHVYGYGGATETGEPEIFLGIYLDNQSNNLLVEKNTIAYAGGGIHGNAGTFNNHIKKNICYGNKDNQMSMADWGTHDYIADYAIDTNILVCTDENTLPFNYICYKDICEIEKRAEFSSNYYINPYNKKIGFPGNRNFRQWKAEIDTTAKIAFFAQQSGETPKTELYTNKTHQVKTISLNGFYLDLDEQPVREFQLQPYSSKVVVAIKTSDIKRAVVNKPALLQYPNPISPGERITKTSIVRDKIITLSIIDLSGRCKVNKKLHENYYTIPDDIPTGLYIIKASANHQVYTSKIIIRNTK